MDEWVHILSNQWYITLPTHGITWFVFELNKFCDMYKCIMWSSIISIAISISKFPWIRLSRVLTMSSIRQKCHLRLYCCVHLLIYKYIPYYRQSTLTHVNNKTVLFYTIVLYFALNPYISNISNLYNPDENMSL